MPEKMVDPQKPVIDLRSGFCKSNSTFYSKRNPLNLPQNPSLDVTTFISSQTHRGTTAFIDAATGHRMSFSDLWRAVDRVADCLHHDIGIRRGDVVLILSPNSIYIPVVCLSVMSLGAVVTTANPLNTADEISKQIADNNPTLAFTTLQLAPKLAAAMAVVLTDDEEPTRGVRVVGMLREMVKKEPSVLRVRDRVNQDDTAVMLYSSGTTGPSKGVISSHGNLIAHVARFGSEPSKRGQTYICTVPMFHSYGFLVFALTTVALGSTVVILRRFGLNDMMDAVEKYRATILAFSPPVLVAMINGADLIKAKYDLSSLKMVRSGGAPLSKEVTEGFLEKYPTVDIFQAYALTESNGAGASTESVEESRRYGTSGALTSDVEAKIVDPNTGRVLGVNQTGELWLKGPSISKGYFKNEEATNETINLEGWLKTGDLCYIDDDGLVFVVDRLKELIKYKGYQVAPVELEALLITHPEISDAAVIPFPDKEAGQYPMAYVVRKPESNLSCEQVIEFISKQVAPYKKIRKVAFINFIPKTASGKTLRKDLPFYQGYFKNEEATNETINLEGWLKTGDLCYIDDDGLVFVVDRLKELIKYKGYQVAPVELEALLITHPEISDAAVIPFPDKEAGQYPMAYVVRKPESNLSCEQVIEFISKQVAPYKKIRKVAFINFIPKTASGKTLRKDLIKHATSKL